MDDQATIRTYGNPNLPQGTPDRPLVTFAVFAYNQEKYIREAVEGALSQTYSPLEIILSDDCSSDRTFDIIQEMSSAYKGPHLVRVRRSHRNLGLIGHINDVIHLVRSNIVLVAAGDDVSFPYRTVNTVNAFLCSENIMAIYSDCSKAPPSPFPNTCILKRISALEIALMGGGIGMGATYAYRRECFVLPRDLPHHLFSEDRILPMRASILGEVRFLSLPTIMHRDTPTSLTKILSKRRALSQENVDHLLYILDDSKKLLVMQRIKWAYILIILIKIRVILARESNLNSIKSYTLSIIVKMTHKIIRKTYDRKHIRLTLESPI